MKNPMLILAAIFKSDHFTVNPPQKTRGKPAVDIRTEGTEFFVQFSLRKIVQGQRFLGLYPTARNLPDANNSKIGDYGLLASGEVVQIGE
jgi:hypothetical protein